MYHETVLKIADEKCLKMSQISAKLPTVFFLSWNEFLFGPFFKSNHYLENPITPQARRPPAFPVVLLSSCPPLPRSSTSAWMTIVRPIMDLSPLKLIIESVMSILATPSSPAWTFPRSPAWRSPKNRFRISHKRR